MEFRTALLSCMIFVVAGCSADDPTRHNTFVPLTSLELTGTYASMADMTVNQYRAVGDFSGMFTRDVTDEVTWRIENKKIAAVSNTAGSRGLVTALFPGETAISAVFGDFLASAPVVVTDASLTGIEIRPQDAELQVGVTRQYEAAGIFSDDSQQDITTLVTWVSSDPDVAAIDSAGLVTALEPGVSTISGAWQGIEATASLLVPDAVLTAITLTPEDADIARGTTVQFEAEGLFSDDTTRDITDMVDWQSSDTGVAAVDNEGLASGVAPGEIEISASFAANGGTISATSVLTVTSAVIVSITITPENSTVQAGENQQFTATGTFSDGSGQDITDLASWSTSNNSVGTISNSSGSRGLFISIGPGAAVIEAIFGGISGATVLTVE